MANFAIYRKLADREMWIRAEKIAIDLNMSLSSYIALAIKEMETNPIVLNRNKSMKEKDI